MMLNQRGVSVFSALGKNSKGKNSTCRIPADYQLDAHDTGHRMELVTYIRLFLPKAVSWKRLVGE